jgi:hypothetical protein
MSFVVRWSLGVASVACPALAQAQSAATAAPSAPAPVRVYMRNEGAPMTFSAHSKSARSKPTWCISPCDAQLLPGDYRLELNGLKVQDTLMLRQPGTLRGEYQSRVGARSAAWLALNVGGIIGGVFITVGMAGGSKLAYFVGGGVLAGATAIFFITYRADRASVSFTPDAPPDVHGMPDPASMTGTRQAVIDRQTLGASPRGFGFRIVF